MTVGTSTANNMMLAALATVSVGGTDIGAMVGETTYTIDIERYHPDLHGVWGDLVGTGFVTRAVPRLTTTMAETSYFQLTVLMDHLGISSDASTDTYGSGTLGQLAAADYQEIIASGMETCGNKSVTIKIDNAYVSSAVNVTLSDDEITTYEVEFTGAYDASYPSKLPSAITIEI